MYYKIDGRVVFFPDDKALKALNSSIVDNNIVVLHTPAARCLSTLLDNQGRLVTQKMLFEAVWERYDLEPSSNSLYQSISTIRKNMSLLGINKTIIVTRPREGFFIPDDILIEVIRDDFSGLMIAAEDGNQSEVDKEERSLSVKFLRAPSIFRIKLLGVVLLLCSMALYLTPDQLESKNHFSHFIASERNDRGCFIYYNRDSTDFIKHQKFMETHHYKCIKYPYVYVETYTHAPKLSVIRCDEDMKKIKSPICVSEYYADYK